MQALRQEIHDTCETFFAMQGFSPRAQLAGARVKTVLLSGAGCGIE